MNAGSRQRHRRLRPRLWGYAIALAVALTAAVVFGWAGCWLGLALLMLTRIAVWALPLIRLSYASTPEDSRAGR